MKTNEDTERIARKRRTRKEITLLVLISVTLGLFYTLYSIDKEQRKYNHAYSDFKLFKTSSVDYSSIMKRTKVKRYNADKDSLFHPMGEYRTDKHLQETGYNTQNSSNLSNYIAQNQSIAKQNGNSGGSGTTQYSNKTVNHQQPTLFGNNIKDYRKRSDIPFDNTNSVKQLSPNDFDDLTPPDFGDDDDLYPPLPVGDGVLMLILLSVIYGIYTRRKLFFFL